MRCARLPNHVYFVSAQFVQSEFDGDDVDNDDDDDDDDTGEYDDDPGGGDDDGGDAEDDDGDGTATVFVVCCCVLLHGANRGKDGDVAEGKATMALIHSPMNLAPWLWEERANTEVAVLPCVSLCV